MERSIMTLNEMASDCHAANEQWWMDPRTGERLNRNKGMVMKIFDQCKGEKFAESEQATLFEGAA